MPASISSNTSRLARRDSCGRFQDQHHRDASPPDATLASGFGDSPTFAEK
jgi:hypothetical protein